MRIIILEPFFTGSHKQWAEGYQRYSEHDIQILSLKGKHWKWRMYGGAVSLAKQFMALDELPDLILATDMLDFTTFLALTKSRTANIRTAIYFHENQLTYPWNSSSNIKKEQRDYSFINYISALVADRVFFNSEYHKNSFLTELPNFLKQFPDNKELQNVDIIASKSEVLPLGLDLIKFDAHKKVEKGKLPLILWNHRWEYDKRPDDFFEAMYHLKDLGIRFELAILGKDYERKPACFDEAKVLLKDEIVYFGYANSFEEYASWLWKADILPVTSNQDFFGGSVVEAMYCHCFPILPKRLAYPEHIELSYQNDYFYEGNRQLKARLVWAIQNLELLVRSNADYQKKIVSYDWKTLAAKYDSLIENG